MGQTATKCMSSSNVLNSVIPHNFKGKEMDSAPRRKAKKKKWKKATPLSSTPYVIVTRISKKENDSQFPVTTTATNINKESINANDFQPRIEPRPKHFSTTAQELNSNSLLLSNPHTDSLPSTMDLAMDDPDFLVDWEVFVEGYGFGYCIEGAKSRDNSAEVTVKLQDGRTVTVSIIQDSKIPQEYNILPIQLL